MATSITLDSISTFAIYPVVTDDSNNPISNDLPIRVSLADLAAFISSPSGIPQADLTNRGTVLMAAAVPALTNNSGGTSGGNTIAAVTDVASAANAIATLATKFNALRSALVSAGVIAS